MDAALEKSLSAFLQAYQASYIGQRIAFLTLAVKADPDCQKWKRKGESAIHAYRHAKTPTEKTKALMDLSEAKKSLNAIPKMAELTALVNQTKAWFRPLDAAIGDAPDKEIEDY